MVFKLKFEPVSPEADAKNKIIGMKQGKCTFGELVADFETWASRTGWSNQNLFDCLKQTLNANYINWLLYFLVVAKDYAMLKAYGHLIDLQVTDLQNNQRQAGATSNNSSSAPRLAPGFHNPNMMDIDVNNIDSHFQGLSNEDIIKKWRKWMKDHCCCCSFKLHKNSLKKHPGPPVCNHCSRTVAVAPYFLLFFVFFSLALIATAPHTWLSHGRHAEATQSSCNAHSASFASRISGYLVTQPFLNARSRTSPFPSKSCD
jgi:hypothetical protein